MGYTGIRELRLRCKRINEGPAIQSKTAVKTLSVFMLLAILSALLLTGCGKPGNGPDGTGTQTAPAAPGTDMSADAGRRYVKTEAGSANDLVANGLYANCYSDAPDIPPAGSVCFTPLAAYICKCHCAVFAKRYNLYYILGQHREKQPANCQRSEWLILLFTGSL